MIKTTGQFLGKRGSFSQVTVPFFFPFLLQLGQHSESFERPRVWIWVCSLNFILSPAQGRNARKCSVVSCPCQLFWLCKQRKPQLFLLPLSHCQFLISLNLLWDQRKGSLAGRASAVQAQQWETIRVAELPCAPWPFCQRWDQNTWPCHRCTKLKGELAPECLERDSALSPSHWVGAGALLKPSAANQGFN